METVGMQIYGFFWLGLSGFWMRLKVRVFGFRVRD